MNMVYVPGCAFSKAVIVKIAVLLSLGANVTGFELKLASKGFAAFGELPCPDQGKTGYGDCGEVMIFGEG